jgi:uncharacterized protein YqeY
MPLKEKLMEDLKESMKSKNKVRKDTITMVRATKQMERWIGGKRQNLNLHMIIF